MPLQKMKSLQAKPKGRRRNGKLKNVKLSTGDTNGTVNTDLSNLRKPIDTSISALFQVSKLLENGTDEVKSILSYECDIIYECRICRSLFRSIINLISHKREYCREKFNITLHKNILGDFNAISTRESVIHMYKTGQTSIKNSVKNDRILRSHVSKEEPRKKDLSTIVEKLNKQREENMKNNSLSKSKIQDTTFDTANNQHIYLEPIDTNGSAVYQTVTSLDTMDDTINLIKEQITELQNLTDQHFIVSEGHTHESQSEKSDSPIQVDINNEENDSSVDGLSSLVCTICNAKFSTKKTLTFHIKTLHMSQRMYYPCPCCTSTFANTWSVHRHLSKVHKKTNEQVRKLRSHIQEKAFHREAIAMEDLEETRTSRHLLTSPLKNNEIIMKNNDIIPECNSKFDGEYCTRCERKFENKAALSAHSQYCQAPVTARDNITMIRQSDRTLPDSTLDNALCEIQETNVINTNTQTSANENTLDINSGYMSSSLEIIEEDHETSIRVQTVSSLSKEDWDMLETGHNYMPECSSVDNNNDLNIIVSRTIQNIDDSDSLSFYKNRDSSRLENYLQSNKHSSSPEVVCTSTNEISSVIPMSRNKRKKSSHSSKKQSTDLKEKNITKRQENNSKSQPSCSIQLSEAEQTLLMEKRLANFANLRKLQCLICKRKFTSVTNLRRHVAIHIGWYRYRCKLCAFKCFVKCDCVAHCNKMHNAQNNRATIADVVVEIPQSEYTCNEDIVMDVTNIEENMDNPDIVDVSASSGQPKRYEDINNSSDANTCVIVQNEATTTSEQVTESHGNVECKNVSKADSNETTMTPDLAEYIMKYGSEKLDAHPDLQRMIMEVIFGSGDTVASKQTDKLVSDTDNNRETRGNIDAIDNNIASIDESRKASCSISDNSTSQRPTRNRIKPLNEDFVYNLKEASFQKDCTLFKETPFQLNKSLTKRHLHLCDSKTLNTRKKAKLYN